MQVLVHFAVLEGIVGGFLGGGDGGVEVLELVREAHAHFERVRHGAWLAKSRVGHAKALRSDGGAP